MDSSYAIPEHGDALSGAAASAKLPVAIDFSHHISLLARSRITFAMKQMYPYMRVPGMIALAGGIPSPEYFPFETISTEVQHTNAFPLDPPRTPKAQSQSLLSWIFGSGKKDKKDKTSLTIPKYAENPMDPMALQLSTSLQYAAGTGHPLLAQFLREFVQKVYRPGYADFEVLVNVGATDGWSKVVQLLLERDDAILVEEWTYPGAEGAFIPLGVEMVSLKMDGEGIIPQYMEETLANWDEGVRGRRRPRVLYTVPTGQNPTGATASSQRRKAIYDIAVKYDIIICEDEPYFFLATSPWKKASDTHKTVLAARAEQTSKEETPAGQKQYLDSLPPSYLRFDYQGRVIRLDTFSKTVAPGSRIGWFTCNPQFAERILRGQESSTQAPCGFGSVLITKMLTTWGFDGYVRWLRGIGATYRMRRDWMCDLFAQEFDLQDDPSNVVAILDGRIKGVTGYAKSQSTKWDEKKAQLGVVGHGKTPLISFVPPTAGMFVFLGIHIGHHPDFNALRAQGHVEPARELMERLWRELAEELVLLAPGYFFDAQPGTPHDGAEEIGFFRLSYSIATHEEMARAIKTIHRVLVRFFRIKE